MKLWIVGLAIVGSGVIADCDGEGTDTDGDDGADSGVIAADEVLAASNRSGNYELYVLDPDDEDADRLTASAEYNSWWPRISPDRRRVLFYRTPRDFDYTAYGRTSLWIMDADGTDTTRLLPQGIYGWNQQGHAEWSPEGERLVMFGGDLGNTQIYITDENGGEPERVTDGTGLWLDPSWSPDGNRLVVVGCEVANCPAADYEVFTFALNEGGDAEPVQLTDNAVADRDPYFSPDGTRIVWRTQTAPVSNVYPEGVWNLRIADVDGANAVAVTSDSDAIGTPGWSTDGDLIYFPRLIYGRADGWDIYSIRPDGNGLSLLADDQPASNVHPDN